MNNHISVLLVYAGINTIREEGKPVMLEYEGKRIVRPKATSSQPEYDIKKHFGIDLSDYDLL